MRKRPENGFTLIDVMIGISIFSLIAITMSLLLRKTYQTYALETFTAGNILEGQSALLRISRLTRQALEISDSYELYATGPQVLILKMAGIDNQQLIVPLTYDYVIYRQNPDNPQKLQEIVIAATQSSRKSATRNIGGNLSSWSLEFRDPSGQLLQNNYSTAKEVTIKITQEKTTKQEQSVQLRNY